LDLIASATAVCASTIAAAALMIFLADAPDLVMDCLIVFPALGSFVVI